MPPPFVGLYYYFASCFYITTFLYLCQLFFCVKFIILTKTLKILIILLRGTPNIPTVIAVPIFNPIWKLNIVPIIFITNISIPPIIEFPINFSILFSGRINILPTISKKNIQAK